MVRGCLLVLSIAALDLAGLARQRVRKPSILGQINSILAHSILPDLYPFSPQSISLTRSRPWTSLSLVNNGQ